VGYGCRNAFEDEAVTYDDTLYILPHYNEVIDSVLAYIDFPKDARIRVLDLGCGTGTLIKRIKEKYLNAYFYAVDFSSAMLSVAQKKMSECENVYFFEEDIFKINENKYPYFDLIVSTFVLHNYENQALYDVIFKKIINLLSVGGKFVLGDLIQCERIEEQEYEKSIQIEEMKKNHLSDEEIERWLNLLNDEDFPLPVITIHFNDDLNINGCLPEP
jgi:tRNA (cmo5U34)-methyltransferase